MDNTLCDYRSAHIKSKKENPKIEYPQSVEGFFENLEPIEGAIEAVEYLRNLNNVEVLFLTAPSIKNRLCYTEKANWIYKYFGEEAQVDLIISSHKNKNIGEYLIDDCPSGKGQDKFNGELILFGSDAYKNWSSVIKYLDKRIKV